MKIKYDMQKNYSKCYNEALGIATNKRSVLKGNKVLPYLSYGYIFLLITLILLVSSRFIYSFFGLCLYTKFLMFLNIWLILLLCAYFIYFFIRINTSYARNSKGYLQLSIEGIINTQFMGIKMIFAWKKIEAIVISNNTLVIFTDTPIYFFLNNDDKNAVIKALKSYKRNIKVIDLQKNSKN